MILGAGGLIGLLIVVFILISLQSKNAETVLKTAKPMEQTARRLAGMDASGMKVRDSITFEPISSGSRTDALLVKTIVPEGPMATYFGLQKGDQIIQVGPRRVRDIGDDEMAEDEVLESRARAWPLVIKRNGTEMTLPIAKPASPGTGLNAPSEAAPANAPSPDNRSPLQRQLDSIQKVPTH
jgi:hypothetical protein